MLAYINVGMPANLLYQLLYCIDMPTLTSSLKIDKEKGEVKATFRIPVDMMKKLKYKSIDDNTSVNALVVKALTEFLKK